MKIFSKILFAIILLASQNSFAFNNMPGADDIIKLYIGSEYQKVIDIVKNKNPEELTATELYYLGLSYYQIKNIKASLNAFEKCVKIDSANTGYRLNYSRSLNQIGRIKDAVINYQKIIEKDSSNVAAMFDLGIIYVNRKDFISAKPIFEKLSILNSNDFLSAYYAALANYQTAATNEDTVKAGDYIFKARLLNFEFIPSSELSGIYHLNLSDYERAYNDYSLLAKLNPANAEYFYRAGFCSEKTKNYTRAVDYFKKAIIFDSTAVNYFSHLGYVYFMTEKYDSSISAYSNSAALDPENPASYLNIALVYEKIDSLQLAKSYFEKALQFYPYSNIIYNTEKLIALNYRLKNYEQAQLLCEQVLTLSPNSPQSLFYLACSYDATGKTGKALECYKAAASVLSKDDSYKAELKYVTDQIDQINAKIKERKFWEGKINE